MSDITIADKIACVERELALRRNVYPRRIERRQMTQAKADHEIACMEAILADLRREDEPRFDDVGALR